MSGKTLAEVAEKMAEVIREWNRAKREREEWRPVPGMVPPDKYLNNAKKANVLLTQALEEYEAFQQGFAADICPDCKGKGIVKDGFAQLFECARCHGSGQRR